MLRGNDHICRSEQCIWSGRIDQKRLILVLDPERYLGALRASDPVFLGNLDLLNIVHMIETFDQLVRVVCDLEHPLGLHLSDDLGAAALAHAVHNLLVGESHLAGSAEIDRHLALVCKPFLEQLQKDPLCPFVIFLIRRIHFLGPVEGVAKCLQLILKMFHVVSGDDLRMDLVLDRIVFRRQTERVPAHRKQYVISLHPALSRHDIHRRVRSRMPHVKSLPRRVWKLYQRVILWFGPVHTDLERLLPVPDILPFFLNVLWRILFVHLFLLLFSAPLSPGTLIFLIFSIQYAHEILYRNHFYIARFYFLISSALMISSAHCVLVNVLESRESV